MNKSTFVDLPDDILTYLTLFLSPGSLYCMLDVSKYIRSTYSREVLSTHKLLISRSMWSLSPFFLDILNDIFCVDSVPLFQYFEHIEVITTKIYCKKILISDKAVKKGAINILKYIYRKDDPEYSKISTIAAQCGQLEILQWLSQYKLDQDYSMEYAYSISGGHIEIIKWLHEICHPSYVGSKFNWGNLRELVPENKHVEVLEWLTDNGFH